MKMYGMGSRASLAFRPVPPLPPPKHYRAEITMLMSPPWLLCPGDVALGWCAG